MQTTTERPGIEDADDAAARADRRVLVLSTDLGGGHDALAAGLRDELAQRDETIHVEVENGLRVVNPALNELARDGYKGSVERQPWTYQLWYWLLSATALARIVRWMAWRGMRRQILARIERSNPDVVVSTYPFLTAVLGKLRREGDLHVPAVGLLIDSGPHDLWLAPGIDLHVAMNPADCQRARDAWPPQSYYPPLDVTSARPAVDPRCRLDTFDRRAGREQFDLPQDARVLLVSGGSWGLALPDEVLLRILEESDLFLAIAVGRNDQLADHLEQLLPAERSRVIRFTREMPTLLHASDAALLNAGGMTCHECFALGTPVILFDPLPGHGRSAARALDEDELAAHPRDQDALLATLEDVGRADGELMRRAMNARSLADQPRLGDVVLSATAREFEPGAALTTKAGQFVAQRATLVIALLVAFGVGSALWSQRSTLVSFDWNLSPTALLAAIALVALGPMTQAVAFWILVRQFGARTAGLGDALAVWSWSALARYAPGGVMMVVVRVREGERLSATRTQVLGTSLYEQALAVVGAATVSVVAFVVAATDPPSGVAIVAILGIVGVVALRPRLLGGRLLSIARRFGAELEQLPRGRAMALVLALNVAGWIAVGAGARVALDGMVSGDPPTLAWMVAVYALAWMIGFVTPLAPGGLGVREAVLTSFLAPIYGVGAAAVIALGLRVVHIVGDLLASAIIELGYRLRGRTFLGAIDELASR
jgi:UDP-N-acetylglucosamine:LPS N-acetylglucosamine transferase